MMTLCLCPVISLLTEGDIFVLCQAGNVWIEYTISLFQIQFYTAVFYGVLRKNLSRNISPFNFFVLHLKIQLEMARLEPKPSESQSCFILFIFKSYFYPNKTLHLGS